MKKTLAIEVIFWKKTTIDDDAEYDENTYDAAMDKITQEAMDELEMKFEKAGIDPADYRIRNCEDVT